MKIAIVCNGIKSIFAKGEVIDSCDHIIRMNRFRIEGYEAFIGSRIDIISLMLTGVGATSGILGFDPLIGYVKKSSAIWIPDKYREEHKESRQRATDHYQLTKDFEFVDDVVYDNLYNKVKNICEALETPYEWYYPDSGMTIIEKVVKAYPGAEILVAGFDPGRHYMYRYYWEKTDGDSEAFNYHPQIAESILYEHYLKAGKIKELI